MKTLKQMFQELLDKLEKTPYKLSPNDLTFLVQCWLTQKRLDNSETKPCPHCTHCAFGKNDVIAELLEELKL